ncbi:MAG: ribosomal protein S18-alanine N-acetyltransferase, partial [Nitriliruptoraceae bacterium]
LVAERAPRHLDARPAATPTPAPAPVIVGAALGQVLVDEGHVLDLAVAPAVRGHGLGRRLLTALLDELAARGAVAHTLEVRPSNLAALALYRGSGFVVEGRRRRYYPDGEDALLLWRRGEEGGD